MTEEKTRKRCLFVLRVLNSKGAESRDQEETVPGVAFPRKCCIRMLWIAALLSPLRDLHFEVVCIAGQCYAQARSDAILMSHWHASKFDVAPSLFVAVCFLSDSLYVLDLCLLHFFSKHHCLPCFHRTQERPLLLFKILLLPLLVILLSLRRLRCHVLDSMPVNVMMNQDITTHYIYICICMSLIVSLYI